MPASYNDLFADPEVRDHVGWVYYQREVRVPRGWHDDRILLRFDAATHAARVYVDDRLVGEHVGGYTPFDVDVTDLVVGGRILPPDGRRQRRPHERDRAAGQDRGRHGRPPPADLLPRLLQLRRPRPVGVAVQHGRVSTSPMSPWSRASRATTGSVDYRVATSDAAEVQGAARGRVRPRSSPRRQAASGTLTVPEVVLWRPGAAYLYELTVEALADDQVVDSYAIPVGVRTVEVRGHEFLINGEPFYFTGFGKHEDAPVRGKGHDDAFMVHDFQLMEWIGANSFRTSHYPYAEEVLEFADRHGIVVIDETAAVGLNMGVVGGMSGTPPFPTFSEQYANANTQAAHAQHLRELIARDKNHPCVVMWCIANEPASNEDGALEYFEPLVQLTRELDPTRPVTYSLVMFATFQNDKIIDLFDVVSMNRYYGWYIATGDLAARRDVPPGRHPGLDRPHRQADHDDRVRRGHPARRALHLGRGLDRGVPARLPRHESPRLRPLPAVRR